MKEVWKVFFRLKGEEIKDWWEYKVKENFWFVVALLVIIGISIHFIGSLGWLIAGNAWGYTFFVYPIILLIWLTLTIVKWGRSNFKKAKEIVAYRNKMRKSEKGWDGKRSLLDREVLE